MNALVGRFGQVIFAPDSALARPSAVVLVSDLSSISSAVGPTSVVPSTVLAIRMPFPIFPGTWKIAE